MKKPLPTLAELVALANAANPRNAYVRNARLFIARLLLESAK